MLNLSVKNYLINKKLQKILNEYLVTLNDFENNVLETIFFKFLRYSDNSYYLYFIVIYCFYFFKKIDINNKLLSKIDKNNILKISELFGYENSDDYEKFIEKSLLIDEHLFLIKLIIKQTVLSNEKKYLDLIPNKEAYYKSIGYLYIPLLLYKNYSKFESFFQDIYFEKVYPIEFKNTKDEFDIIFEGESIGEAIMLDLNNNLSELLKKLRIFGNISTRKKSYFSLYNKRIRRPGDYKIRDFIGARIILKNMKDLEKFCKLFEQKFHIDIKKDYIKNPKENGYQSIHYYFNYVYNNINLPVELQVRTIKMDEKIHKDPKINYFSYALKENKYGELFKEIHIGMEIIEKLMHKKISS